MHPPCAAASVLPKQQNLESFHFPYVPNFGELLLIQVSTVHKFGVPGYIGVEGGRELFMFNSNLVVLICALEAEIVYLQLATEPSCKTKFSLFGSFHPSRSYNFRLNASGDHFT